MCGGWSASIFSVIVPVIPAGDDGATSFDIEPGS